MTPPLARVMVLKTVEPGSGRVELSGLLAATGGQEVSWRTHALTDATFASVAGACRSVRTAWMNAASPGPLTGASPAGWCLGWVAAWLVPYPATAQNATAV